MSIRFLKVKIKSLTAEARIIRLEEGRSRGELRAALRSHRQWDVRREQRATQLAYVYLRGRARVTIEPGARSEPDWDRVTTMVKKYGMNRMVAGDPAALEFEAWRTAA
jgi:hypothetical protein